MSERNVESYKLMDNARLMIGQSSSCCCWVKFSLCGFANNRNRNSSAQGEFISTIVFDQFMEYNVINPYTDEVVSIDALKARTPWDLFVAMHLENLLVFDEELTVDEKKFIELNGKLLKAENEKKAIEDKYLLTD